MGWFNYYGLIAVVLIMIPNIVFAIKCKGDISNPYKNKAAYALEQVGRYGCMAFMIFNTPYTYFNSWFAHALIVYLAVNGVLAAMYCVLWAVFWNKSGRAKALALSIIPSVIFLFSGVVFANIPLIAFAVIFAVCHILISYKNAEMEQNGKDK
ncbi:MAG: hypothetical protein K2M36_03775 [Clostridia bacterium]|nr:hypothetical protein [Clostridia bacterium]